MVTDVLTGELHQASQGSMVPLLEKLPPLENGDRLTRSDFEQRYEAMPHVKKAELIEGIVYMPSPVRVRSHGETAWSGHELARCVLRCDSRG